MIFLRIPRLYFLNKMQPYFRTLVCRKIQYYFKTPKLVIKGSISNIYLMKVKVLVSLSCLILCDPMDCSPLDTPVHGSFCVRILEWAAISFSRVSSRPTDQTHIPHVSCIGRRVLCHEYHLGSPD